MADQPIDPEEFKLAAQAFLRATRSTAMVAFTVYADGSGYGIAMHGRGLVTQEAVLVLKEAREMLEALIELVGCDIAQEDSFAEFGPDHGKPVIKQ